MKNYLNTLIISIATIVAAMIFANAFLNRSNHTNAINVTGLGTKDFTSDLIVWSGSFMRKNLILKDAYAALDQDRAKIRSYLDSKGISADNYIFSAVEIDKEFDQVFDNDGNNRRTVFSGYRLRQNVQIESKEVDKIESISRQVSELINSGIEFYSNNPEYYYTKLAALKIEMIAEATKDAQQRALKMAENAGGDLGGLKRASMGVFQIVAQNSSEDFSWGGSFNTSSKKKTANITIKLEYGVD
ncbi:MAG: SIMPL domain-containing protein [Bacteroidia bacterium]|nr:SIMPL domain-containing protein [Bacteroidia bacterium]